MPGKLFHQQHVHLVELARMGSKEARRTLIEAHVGLAFNVAKSYKDDQALSDALLALVEAVDAFCKTGRDSMSLTAYLQESVRKAAYRHVRDEARHAARISKGFRENYRADSSEFFAAFDYVASLCQDDMERAVLFTKAQGYGVCEVAEKLGISQPYVSITLDRLKTRHLAQERDSSDTPNTFRPRR